MSFLSSFYPQPVVAGTTEGTFAEGNHSHELDELDASGISSGKVLTANGVNAASWEDPTGEVEEAPEDGIIYGRKDADWVDITEPANLQIRRGTAAEVAAITPLEGEPVWETDTKKLVVGDGATAGGITVGKFPLDGNPMNPTGSGANIPSAGAVFISSEVEAIGGVFVSGPFVAGNARGKGAADLQGERTSAEQVASGGYSFIAGSRRSTASGTHSTILSSTFCTVSGESSCLLGGNTNTISGGRSFGFFSNITQDYAVSFYGTSDRFGMYSHGSKGSLASFGPSERAQAVQFILKGRTVNATPTQLIIHTSTYVTIPENVALFGTVEICAIEETNATEAAHYLRKFGIQNLGGTTTLIGNVTTVGTDYESDAGYDVSITAYDDSDYLKIEVTGDSAKTLRWVATVRGTEMDIV